MFITNQGPIRTCITYRIRMIVYKHIYNSQ